MLILKDAINRLNYSTAVPSSSSTGLSTTSSNNVTSSTALQFDSSSSNVSRFIPKTASHTLSTPKRPFFDDHRITTKYTSPELRTQTDLNMFEPASNTDFGTASIGAGGGPDDSRRFSIDSFSRPSNITVNLPQFNRFNTISENEFEEPDINQKSLELEMTGNLNRLSILQTRNQRAPPHLKSSYALEMNLPTPSDRLQPTATTVPANTSSSSVLKENRQPLTGSGSSKTNLASNQTKRRATDDTRATDSPPRKTSSSHMVGI